MSPHAISLSHLPSLSLSSFINCSISYRWFRLLIIKYKSTLAFTTKAFPSVALGVGKMIKHEIAKLYSDIVNSLKIERQRKHESVSLGKSKERDITLPYTAQVTILCHTTRVRRPNQENFVTVLVSMLCVSIFKHVSIAKNDFTFIVCCTCTLEQ